ncbi:MAG TPA: glycosyltransferase [Methanosarcinales archaeon]|nr:glycosyltransferase [Methanosarcinales archaeon]
MPLSYPLVSIIIPCHPGTNPSVLNSIEKLDYPKDRYEILVEEGFNPSEQRNRGIKKAKGEIIAFTDDDCSMDSDWLKKAIKYFEDKKVGVVGGPNLTPKNASFLSHCFGYAMESYFGTASMSTRYRIAKVKEVTEKNLIFNNLFVRKEVFDRGIYLNEKMFPNEENEFMHRVQKNDFKLVYAPDVYVYHPRKNNILGFSKQLYGYGKGRMYQSVIQPDSFRIIFALPSVFFLSILLIPISIVFHIELLYTILITCTLLYFAIAFIVSFIIAINKRNAYIVLLLPFIFFILHFSYGLGFLREAFKNI